MFYKFITAIAFVYTVQGLENTGNCEFCNSVIESDPGIFCQTGSGIFVPDPLENP
jgi:hypothetical protein